MSDDLARQVDAAQSMLSSAAASEAKRLEQALAACNRAVAEAMATLQPAARAGARALAGGCAIFAGRGSPLTQGLAMGLDGAVTAADLDALEAYLCPDGHGAKQLELSPFADPSLAAELARRGYRVHEWQLVWSRTVPREPPAPRSTEVRITPLCAGEEELFFRVVLAGFLESEAVPASAIELMRPTAFAERHELFLAWLGDEAIGGATLAWADGVAFLGGSGVRPAFRRHGAQAALIGTRIARAAALGCELLCANTLPASASRRNMERHGFAVAYPKLVMLKDEVAAGSQK